MQSQADRVFDQSVITLRAAIDTIARSVAAPVAVHTANGFHYRYREANVRQALVLKAVRNYSALLALRSLIDSGLYLDAGATMRILDEVCIDILFIAGPFLFGKQPDGIHRRFITEFFQEEFDHDDPLKSTQKRDRVPRKKIRAYVARTYDSGSNPSDTINVFETIENTFSGYIHGAAVHILDGYDGRRFRVPMVRGDDTIEALREQRNYYAFRAITAVATAAKAIGDDGLFKMLHHLSNELFDETGEDRPHLAD